MGLDVNSDFIGWNGNSTLSVETVLESIVTLKKNFALPEISIEFKKDKLTVNPKSKQIVPTGMHF